MRKWLRDFWTHLNQSPADRYLSRATDLRDLESRQKDLIFGRVKF